MSKIKIEVSARHCHISRKDLDKLFGKGYKLTVYKELSQPGQFAAEETLIVKTKGGKIENMRILGPVRKNTQIEISATDARILKINPPVNLSGNLRGSSGAILVGLRGTLKLKKGIIIAKRHLHCNKKQALELGIKKGQKVSVKTLGDRSVTFHNILVRVREDFDLSIHIDTDEGNASLAGGICAEGEIIK